MLEISLESCILDLLDYREKWQPVVWGQYTSLRCFANQYQQRRNEL